MQPNGELVEAMRKSTLLFSTMNFLIQVHRIWNISSRRSILITSLRCTYPWVSMMNGLRKWRSSKQVIPKYSFSRITWILSLWQYLDNGGVHHRYNKGNHDTTSFIVELPWVCHDSGTMSMLQELMDLSCKMLINGPLTKNNVLLSNQNT